jgi:hypothetical protein
MQWRCQNLKLAEQGAQVEANSMFQTVLANFASSRSVTIALQFWDFLFLIWDSNFKAFSAPGGQISRV